MKPLKCNYPNKSLQCKATNPYNMECTCRYCVFNAEFRQEKVNNQHYY